MATTVGTESKVTDLLSNLISLDYDAIEAYEAAINKLDNADVKAKLIEFKGDHERHTRDLAGLLREFGGQPPKGGDMKRFMTAGKVAFANMFGDRAILQAMKTNEDDTNKAYERAVGHDGELTEQARAVLRTNLDDERRHRAWIEDTIATM
jgi:uncharacterized protein (TIGR02284 family)